MGCCKFLSTAGNTVYDIPLWFGVFGAVVLMRMQLVADIE